MLALAAWLFLPRDPDEGERGPPLHVVLVDASASCARAPAWLGWARDELARAARAAGEAGAELLVASYAEGVGTGFAPGAPEQFLRRLSGSEGAPFDPRDAAAGDGATELAGALELALPLLLDARRPRGELLLLGEPSFTGSSPAGALARLAGAGVRLERRAPPPPEWNDLGLVELRLPPRIEAGALLVASARLLWRPGRTPPARAVLAIELENGAATSSFEREVALPGAAGVFELPLACGPAGFGRTEVRVACRLDPGPDLVRENDRARAATVAEGARVIGVAAEEGALAAARAWLTPSGRSTLPGLEFVFFAREQLAGRLRELDAFVSFDLPLEELPAALCAGFVRGGGGWLALSGWRFLRDWNAGATGPLHELLPLVPRPLEAGPRDIVLLVDGSGSMEGEPFDTVRTAALDLVASALPEDRVSLRFFTTRLEPEVRLRERGPPGRGASGGSAEAARSAARELLALRVPRGATYLLRALQEFRAELGERETLAFLLTDGWDRDAVPDRRALAEEIAADLARSRVRLVVIAVGEAHLELLGHLAGGAERVLPGGALDDLRSIFQRELLAARLAEGALLALRVVPRAPGSLAAEVLDPAVEPDRLPPLERYVRDALRPGAEALWESETGEPVLGLARAGLGRTALFASRPTPDWAVSWSGRPGLGQPAEFESLLRWLARGPGRSRTDLRAVIEGDELVLGGVDEGWPARVGAELSGADGDAVARLELLPPSSLGRDPLHERAARLPGMPAHGDLALALSGPGASGSVLSVERRLADEFAGREQPLGFFPESPGAGERAPSGSERLRSHPAGPWLLGLGLLLLLVAALGRAGGQGERPNVR